MTPWDPSQTRGLYYADGKRIAMRVGGTLKYIIQDNLGSTVVTTNGTVAESRAWYNPFGELYNYWGTVPTDKRFTGQQREYEGEPPNQWNAIYDYGARMYDVKIGRMLQPDALYDPYIPQSLNRRNPHDVKHILQSHSRIICNPAALFCQTNSVFGYWFRRRVNFTCT